MINPIVQPVEYAVSCLPEDDINAPSFTIKVEYREGGKWVVKYRLWFYSEDDRASAYTWRDGAQEPTEDEHFREIEAGIEAWRAKYWHDLDTALRIAKREAPHLRVNGHTVAAALALGSGQ